MKRILLLASAMTAGVTAIAQTVCTSEPEYFTDGGSVTITYNPGESFGLVGESGCGKTTVGKTIAGTRKTWTLKGTGTGP